MDMDPKFGIMDPDLGSQLNLYKYKSKYENI
jgi:hypothetical protein